MGNKAIQPIYISVWPLHLNANSIMGFDLLIKVGKTLAFNKSHPRENSELLSVRCVRSLALALCVYATI